MNRKMIIYALGFILKIEGLLMIPSLLIAIGYREKGSYAFLITIGLLLLIGQILSYKKPEKRKIYGKDGFVIVSLAWILFSMFGGLPFYISREIPSYVDCIFETVSGFTTTGASILTNVEGLSHGMLFWRSFTHWIGGMGVLVFILAIVPLAEGTSVHLMKAETTGPTYGKLVPKLKKTATILYTIYVALTVIMVIFLLFGGMPLFDSVLHAFGTAGTGGFGIKNNSVAYYNSPYIEWVIAIFMLIFAVNFTMFYLILCGNIKQVLKSEELRWYLVIVALSVAAITYDIRAIYNIWDGLRESSFHVASIISTTGFSATDYNVWPEFSKSILFMLTLFGGCAGSTAGGLKIARLVILFKSIVHQIKSLIYPKYVNVVRFEGIVLEEKRVKETNNYLTIYTFIMLLSFLLISMDKYYFETTATAVATTLNNVGPGLGVVGPAGSFSGFSPFSKIVLSLNMLIGRLEIYPMMVLLSPSLYKVKRKTKQLKNM